jgi:hypothetical protein
VLTTCLVPSRVLTWIGAATPKLESLLHKHAHDSSKDADLYTLGAQLAQGLSVVQGVALTHASSKRWLGRRHNLQTLVDLLLVSRHFPVPPAADQQDDNRDDTVPTKTPLTSAVMDTLLCVLVDSSPALRAFEDANGCQAIVRLLKRAGTPREIR